MPYFENEDLRLKFFQSIIKENIATVFASALCIGLIALGTNSLHCLWGLLILINLDFIRKPEKG
jgi:predicted cobalt transporter CbtA